MFLVRRICHEGGNKGRGLSEYDCQVGEWNVNERSIVVCEKRLWRREAEKVADRIAALYLIITVHSQFINR